MMRDLRLAWRMLAKAPACSDVVILTLAPGIGANTAVFSIVNSVLPEPLPYRNPARSVDIPDRSAKDPRLSETFGTYAAFEQYSLHSQSFEQIGFATWAGATDPVTMIGAALTLVAVAATRSSFPRAEWSGSIRWSRCATNSYWVLTDSGTRSSKPAGGL